jgi:hypothetical protein
MQRNAEKCGELERQRKEVNETGINLPDRKKTSLGTNREKSFLSLISSAGQGKLQKEKTTLLIMASNCSPLTAGFIYKTTEKLNQPN